MRQTSRDLKALENQRLLTPCARSRCGASGRASCSRSPTRWGRYFVSPPLASLAPYQATWLITQRFLRFYYSFCFTALNGDGFDSCLNARRQPPFSLLYYADCKRNQTPRIYYTLYFYIIEHWRTSFEHRWMCCFIIGTSAIIILTSMMIGAGSNAEKRKAETQNLLHSRLPDA